MDAVFSNEVLVAVLPAILTVLGVIWGALKISGERKAAVLALLRWAIPLASSAVDVIAPRTANTVDDRLAVFLRVLKGIIEGKGGTLTPDGEAQAKAVFLALHDASTAAPVQK